MRGGRGVSTTMITKAHHQTHQEDQYMIGGGGGLGLSWPPRFYTCNFCRREFRSAQALGGHMNVHRRDRARLRSSSITTPKVITPNPNPNPNLNLNLIPNPNPTQPTLPFSVPSPSTQKSCVFPRYKHVSHGVSPQCASIFEPKKLLVMTRQGNLRAKVENGGYNLNKGRSVVRLGLEIGIFDDDDDDDEDDEDEEDLEDGLDLELRLGYNH